MNRKFIFFLSLLAVGCSGEKGIDMGCAAGSASPIEIAATVTTTITPLTRGAQVLSPEDMGSMGVFCAFTGVSYWGSGTEFDRLDDSRFELSDNDLWVASLESDNKMWDYESVSDRYSFFAYSPHSSDASGITTRNVAGEILLDYVVPSNSLDQPDLLFAEPLKDISPQVVGRVSLTFAHALACVSFGVITSSGSEAQITSISLSGVVGDGVLRWDSDSDGVAWSLGEVSAEPFVIDVEAYSTEGVGSVKLTSESGYLMMIPQTMLSDVEVSLTLDGECDPLCLTIPAGSEWEAGQQYHYVIDMGGDESCTGEFIYSSDQISNCYIINPVEGLSTTIQIPIEDRINNFWQIYAGSTSKKIKANNTGEDLMVDIVWEDFDESFEFEECEIVEDEDGALAVKFVVSEKFREGNVVFVVSECEVDDYGTTISPLWSWHLWFTDYNPDMIAAANYHLIESGKERAYTLSGYEGAVHRYRDAEGVSGDDAVWSGIYSDKFIMDRNIGERDEYASNYGAGNVYYQFGRKDPFPGSGAIYSSGDDPRPLSRTNLTFAFAVEYHDHFLATNTASTTTWCGETAALSAACIWYDEAYAVAGYDEGKSIFDPSPLGWRVPVIETWSYLIAASSCDDLNSVADYNYYGFINSLSSGALSETGAYGGVWSATPSSDRESYCLQYTTSQSPAVVAVPMAYGLPVRSIQE